MVKRIIVFALTVILLCGCGQGKENETDKKGQIQKYEFVEFKLPEKDLELTDDLTEKKGESWQFKEKDTWYDFSIIVEPYDEKMYKNDLVELGEVKEIFITKTRPFKMGEEKIVKDGNISYIKGGFLYRDKFVKMELYSPYTSDPDVPVSELFEEIIKTIKVIEE